jgi:hypothetical protein
MSKLPLLPRIIPNPDHTPVQAKTATLAQATQAIAQLITDLKAIGFYGA